MTRLFLLDDHELVRMGLRNLLETESEFDVVGEAATAAEALEQIPLLRPDVAILDLQLPDGDGIEVCREVRAAMPEIACLLLTSFADDEAVLAAVLAGAAGYVLKQVRENDLISSVRRVARGESLLDPRYVNQLRSRLGHDSEDELLARLSPQERRVLELIAEAKTNRQIAEEMGLAEKTAKNYVSTVLQKLGTRGRTDAAVLALRAAERARPRFGGSV